MEHLSLSLCPPIQVSRNSIEKTGVLGEELLFCHPRILSVTLWMGYVFIHWKVPGMVVLSPHFLKCYIYIYMQHRCYSRLVHQSYILLSVLSAKCLKCCTTTCVLHLFPLGTQRNQKKVETSPLLNRSQVVSPLALP